MESYVDLLKKIEELTRRAEEVKAQEVDRAIAEIKGLMDRYGLTAEDLGLGKAPRRGSHKAQKITAKYRNPLTGETWSGRGRTPKWLAEAEAKGQKRESFAA